MYIYIASAGCYISKNICKIGCTIEPHGRLTNYLTGCPPNMEPSCDIEFYSIWKVTAENKRQLLYFEDLVHEEFSEFRMKREEEGDSEWFDFKDINCLEAISNFVSKQEWTIEECDLKTIEKPRRSILETTKYHKNRKLFVNKKEFRNSMLNSVQAPVIQKLIDFINDEVEIAGHFISPCGSGKTRMTCEAIRHLKRVIICAPTYEIQKQWQSSLCRDDVVFLGGNEGSCVDEILQQESYCVITTYASCKKLLTKQFENTQIVVFDEAHHMAGGIGEDIGETRLFLRALTLKRLFLTFTPRIVEGEGVEILSMDDETIFGKCIAELKLRDLINKGILPDYNIWSLTSEGTGLTAKAEQLIAAWNSKENDVPILNHLIAFTETNAEKDELYNILSSAGVPTLMVSYKEDIKKTIAKFEKSERCILIDCRRIGEGVDIPFADSVAILYPKKSKESIVQTLFRAGRWYEWKSVFHMILCHTEDDDMSSFVEVLVSLATIDEAIRSEIVLLIGSKIKKHGESVLDIGTSSSKIHIEIFGSMTIEKIKNIVNLNFTKKLSKKEIQIICYEMNITTSSEYSKLRETMTELPEDPKPSTITWFDFLNPNTEKVEFETFVKSVVENNKRLPTDYDTWFQSMSYPSLENIRDGYFGQTKTNFLEFIPFERRRR